MNIEMLDKAVRRVPDFPKPGILFYDITGVLVNPDALKFCIDQMVEKYKDIKFDAVAGVESRGFIFAAPFAERLGIPLVLIRKKGKLPGQTYQCTYDLEYGSATIACSVCFVLKIEVYFSGNVLNLFLFFLGILKVVKLKIAFR